MALPVLEYESPPGVPLDEAPLVGLAVDVGQGGRVAVRHVVGGGGAHALKPGHGRVLLILCHTIKLLFVVAVFLNVVVLAVAFYFVPAASASVSVSVSVFVAVAIAAVVVVVVVVAVAAVVVSLLLLLLLLLLLMMLMLLHQQQ